jgi:RNA polymerase primary sigma factor
MKPREFKRLGNGASKTVGTPQQGPEPLPDGPLLDLSNAGVKTFIHNAKKRGYVTHDQVNALLSSEEVKSE